MAKSHKSCMEQAKVIDTFGTYQYSWCKLELLLPMWPILVQTPAGLIKRLLSLLGSDGLWDYVQIVMSSIFDSSLLYLISWVILACSLLPFITLAKWFVATPRGSVMLDCGFSPLMSSLSDGKMRLGDVLLPPGTKQRCLYLRVQGFFTLRKVLLIYLSVALSLHFGWDSQLNTSEMFWIDISRWMIRSRCRRISVYLPWRTAHFFWASSFLL